LPQIHFDGLSDGLHRATADGRAVVAKVRRHAPPDFFAAEARGLAALAERNAIRVPEVFAVQQQAIAIADLGSGRPSTDDWQRAGRGLAQVHAFADRRFGFDADGYCGDSPQDNTRERDGFVFFSERRLLPQARRAFASSLIDAADVRRIEAICTRLHDWLPVSKPVLIHGDLWTGNLHACATGELALIDGGAVHFGWAECDLAMLTLFGEPPRAFFAAYEAAAAIDASWRSRAPLLNLYHLLNHVNLFGASYVAAVRSVLARFG
jgi:fructosamine-3-kinase